MTKLLCDDKWLQLKHIVAPEKGIHGYTFSHEVSCDGKKISILPFRKQKATDDFESIGTQFLLRDEVTPCWDEDVSFISSITGGCEKGVDIVDTAVHELSEEAGYKAERYDFIDLGTCFGTKSTDTVYYLFSIDLTDRERGEAVGDGSELEDKAHCFWTKDVEKAVDPFVYVTLLRLIDYQESKRLGGMALAPIT